MKKYLLLLLLASLLFSACSAPQKSLVGSWKLTSFGPQGSLTPAVPDSQANLTFKDDGTLSGNSGCNGFGGEYKLNGDQITFNGLVSTLMACSDPLMAQEGTTFKVLNGTATYKIEGDTLTITNNGLALVYVSSQVQSYPAYP